MIYASRGPLLHCEGWRCNRGVQPREGRVRTGARSYCLNCVTTYLWASTHVLNCDLCGMVHAPPPTLGRLYDWFGEVWCGGQDDEALALHGTTRACPFAKLKNIRQLEAALRKAYPRWKPGPGIIPSRSIEPSFLLAA